MPAFVVDDHEVSCPGSRCRILRESYSSATEKAVAQGAIYLSNGANEVLGLGTWVLGKVRRGLHSPAGARKDRPYNWLNTVNGLNLEI